MKHFGTYAAAHAYLDESVQRALNAGFMSIEHGNLITDPNTFKLVAKKGAWIVPAMGGFSKELMDHPYYGNPENPAYEKAKRINDNGAKWVQLANKYKVNMGFGTDIVVVGKATSRNLRDYQITHWGESFGNLRTLKAMTSENGKLMALAGDMNNYPKKLGVIEPDAYADLILVDGNPLEDLSLIGAIPSMFKSKPRATPSVPTIRVVVKNGVIVKNTL
jgi:imidazolonepropionase-like amidohydrolase